MEEESEAGPSTAPPAASASAPSTFNKLSCDHCRVRKVGCNRESPCSSCKRLGIPCTYALGYKARSRKDRKPAVASPTRVAERIDYIAEKLDKLYSLFEKASRTSPHAEQVKTFRASTTLVPDDGEPDCGSLEDMLQDDGELHPLSDEDSQYKGDSSLAAHANFTTRALERALDETVLLSRTEEIDSIKGSIRGTPRPNPSPNVDVESTGCPTPSYRGQQLTLPPVLMTLQCLRLLKENSLFRLFWSMAFDSVDQGTQYMLNLYSVSGQPSIPELMITYIGLHSLFLQSSTITADPTLAEHYATQAQVCRDNVEKVLATLPLHLPTTVDCVLAMIMATEYCVGQCKTTMAWTYIGIASRMSQALGLHRVASQTGMEMSVEVRQKSKIFWTLYILEKNLSLQLGRSSTLRDHDITVPLSSVRLSFYDRGPLGILAPQWPQLAHIEGRVYDELYSPQALCRDSGVRTTYARLLADEVQRICEDNDPLNRAFLSERRNNLGKTLDDLLVRFDRISRISLLCLIYRSVSVDRSAFCDECISTARQAIREYSETMTLIGTNDLYLLDISINWVLLTSTCVPFFVILCNAIWTLDATDLRLLDSLISSMEAGQDKLYISAGHLLKTFKPLHNAAWRYITLKTDAASRSTAEAISFQGIYEGMIPETSQDLFPMQWLSQSELMSIDQMVPFAMGDDPASQATLNQSYDPNPSPYQ